MRPPKPSRAARPAPTAPTTMRGTVLIIDDDPDVARALIPRLNAAGFEVVAACDGGNGYWTAQETQPDIILLDYKMPAGNGNQVIGRLKSHPKTRDIPIIMLSAMADVGVQRDVLSLGAVEWVNKPCDGEELIHCINRYL